MSAHLRPIDVRPCAVTGQHCSAPATQLLYNARNELIKGLCGRHAVAELARFKKVTDDPTP